MKPSPDQDAKTSATPWWQRPAYVVLLLGALILIIYANSLRNEFVFDDRSLILHYPKVKSIRNIPKILGLTGKPAYRPLRTATYAIEYSLFGPSPTGFRAVNLAFHLLNSALIFFLFRTLAGSPRTALFGAILFAVHPIQTESVAYISGRRDLLFTLFYLIGFASYVRYRETDRVRYLLATGLAFLLSLLSKEMAISLPLLCIAYDVIRSIPTAEGKRPLPPWQAAAEGVRTAVLRHKVLYVIGTVLLLVLVYLFSLYVYRHNPSRQREMYGGGLGPTLLTSARIFAHYIKLLLFPVTLNADYSYNAFPISYSLFEARVAVALAILGAAWWGIYRSLTYDRWAAFGGLWFFIALLPVSQIIPHHEMMAEHYLYLPSAGLFLVGALVLERALARADRRRRVALMAGFAAIVMLLGVRTVIRNQDWRDSETIWTKTLQTAPGSARVRINVGEIASRKGRSQEAFREFREAVRIQPDDPVNRYNLGLILLRHGKFDEAEREFKEALRMRPDFAKAHVSLGLLHLNRGELDDAERQFRTAIEMRSKKRVGRNFRAIIHNDLGIVIALKGKREEAERSFREAVRLSPEYADARANLAKAYLEKGMTQEGVHQITKAIRLQGSDPRFHYLLAQAYYQQGEKELAAVELGKTLALRADFPEARSLLNTIIREKGSGRGKRG